MSRRKPSTARPGQWVRGTRGQSRAGRVPVAERSPAPLAALDVDCQHCGERFLRWSVDVPPAAAEDVRVSDAPAGAWWLDADVGVQGVHACGASPVALLLPAAERLRGMVERGERHARVTSSG